jgi:transketolase N-terminal domain/subunit
MISTASPGRSGFATCRRFIEAGAGHIGGEMSAIDILTALYFRVLRIWPDQPKRPDRDRFVLSKGHIALALYVTLAKRGFIPGGGGLRRS